MIAARVHLAQAAPFIDRRGKECAAAFLGEGAADLFEAKPVSVRLDNGGALGAPCRLVNLPPVGAQSIKVDT